MKQYEPVVKVIACTRFLGVPQELLNEQDIDEIWAKGQDQGSDGARLIETAGRACYDSFGQEKSRPSADYHVNIKNIGHGSVTEHTSMTFYTDFISRGLTHEQVRHRVGTAISQRSTRYVDESESPWIWHPLIFKALEWGQDKRSDSRTYQLAHDTEYEIDELEHFAKSAYQKIANLVQEYCISIGSDKFTARKQARGAARGALGNALCTSMVWSANIRTLRNYLELRCSPAADAEIRIFANKIYEAALETVPEYFDDYTKVECPDGIGYGLATSWRKI